MKVDEFFDEAARARVAEAVKTAEARTTGQIVPVVVPRSGHYGLSSGLSSFFAAFWMLLLAFDAVSNLVRERTPFTWPLVVALTLTVMTLLALTVPFVSRFFFRAKFEAAARQRAMLAFVEHGVYRTREENGVLLFASLHERKVVVLGDRGVHEKLGDEHWKRAVDTLVAGIRAGDPAAGFCTAIADIGEEMAKAFPRGTSPQPNEISDELRIDR